MPLNQFEVSKHALAMLELAPGQAPSIIAGKIEAGIIW